MEFLTLLKLFIGCCWALVACSVIKDISTIYLLCTRVGSMYIELPLGVNTNPLPMHPIILYEIPCVFI